MKLHEKRQEGQNRFIDYEVSVKKSVHIRQHIQAPAAFQKPGGRQASLGTGPALVRQLAALDMTSSGQERSGLFAPPEAHRTSQRAASVPLILSTSSGHDIIPEQPTRGGRPGSAGWPPALAPLEGAAAGNDTVRTERLAMGLEPLAAPKRAPKQAFGPALALPNFMPLADFDDGEHTLTTMVKPADFEKWKLEGRSLKAVSKWLNATSQEWEWRACTVLEYEAERELYLIQWHCNHHTKQVSRLNLLFDVEQRSVFQHRVGKARAVRDIVEAEMRYIRRVESMGVADSTRVPPESLWRICSRVGAVRAGGTDGAGPGGLRWVPGKEDVGAGDGVLSQLQRGALANIASELAEVNSQAFNEMSFEVWHSFRRAERDLHDLSTRPSCMQSHRRTGKDAAFFAGLPTASSSAAAACDIALDDLLVHIGGRARLQPFPDRVEALRANWSCGNARIMECALISLAKVQQLSKLSFLQTAAGLAERLEARSPWELLQVLHANRAACAELRAEVRTFIRFELPDLIEDRYGEENLYVTKEVEEAMQTQYRNFQHLCRHMLRSMTFRTFKDDLDAFVVLFTRGDGDAASPIVSIDFHVDGDHKIVPSIPLQLYQDAILSCVGMIGNAMVSVQDVILKFLPPDPNNVGELSVGELQTALEVYGIFLGRTKVKSLIATIDEDGDGSVSLAEFLAYIRTEETQLQKLWKSIDTDGTGTLDKEELGAVLLNMGTKLSKKKLAKAFNNIDKDGSGEIEYNEFLDWWRMQSTDNENEVGDDFIDEGEAIEDAVATLTRSIDGPEQSDLSPEDAQANAETADGGKEAEPDDPDIPLLHPEPAIFTEKLRWAHSLVKQTLVRDLACVQQLHTEMLQPFQQFLQTDAETYVGALQSRLFDLDGSEVCEESLAELDSIQVRC
jgi:Ca2+-binding EF-hand superfamily protein